jgi:hypothetical protein
MPGLNSARAIRPRPWPRLAPLWAVLLLFLQLRRLRGLLRS